VGRRKLAAAQGRPGWPPTPPAEKIFSKVPAVVIAERIPRTHGYQVVFQRRGHVVLHRVGEQASTKASAWPAR